MIREIRADEIDDLLALYAHLHAADHPVPVREVVDQTWQKIQTDPNLNYFGAYVEGRLVSSCTLTVIPNLTWACRPYGIIENVVTHAGFRRRGYGKAVVGHALKSAWESDCYKVMLLTGRKSEDVYRFYESVGFDRHAKQAFVAKPHENAATSSCRSTVIP